MSENIHQPRQTRGVLVKNVQRAIVEDVVFPAGHGQTVAQVQMGLDAIQGLELPTQGNALGELPEFGTLEEGVELGLAEQDDLEQLLGRRLQVRQQPKLFEDNGIEILRLVDDDNRPSTGRPLRVEEYAQRIGELFFAGRSGRQSELGVHGLEKLDR